MKRSINLLIGQQRQEAVSVGRYKSFRILSLCLLFTIAVASLSLLLLVTLSPLQQLQDSEREAIASVQNLHPQMAKLLFMHDRLASITTVLQNRHTFDETLTWIKGLLPEKASVTNYTVNAQTISLQITLPTLADADAVISSFTQALKQKQHIASLTVSNVALAPEKNNYQVTLDMLPL